MDTKATKTGPSTRALGNAAKLLTDPFSAGDVLARLDDSELVNVSALAAQMQSERAVARGDLDAIIADAFEVGFGKDNLAHQPWVNEGVVVCPGGLVWKTKMSHNCKFISINNTWVWDCMELIKEDKRSITGKNDGFRAVALVPAIEGMQVDAVVGKARAGQHSMVKAISYEIRKGKLVEVAQRNVKHIH